MYLIPIVQNISSINPRRNAISPIEVSKNIHKRLKRGSNYDFAGKPRSNEHLNITVNIDSRQYKRERDTTLSMHDLYLIIERQTVRFYFVI